MTPKYKYIKIRRRGKEKTWTFKLEWDKGSEIYRTNEESFPTTEQLGIWSHYEMQPWDFELVEQWDDPINFKKCEMCEQPANYVFQICELSGNLGKVLRTSELCSSCKNSFGLKTPEEKVKSTLKEHPKYQVNESGAIVVEDGKKPIDEFMNSCLRAMTGVADVRREEPKETGNHTSFEQKWSDSYAKPYSDVGEWVVRAVYGDTLFDDDEPKPKQKPASIAPGQEAKLGAALNSVGPAEGLVCMYCHIELKEPVSVGGMKLQACGMINLYGIGICMRECVEKMGKEQPAESTRHSPPKESFKKKITEIYFRAKRLYEKNADWEASFLRGYINDLRDREDKLDEARKIMDKWSREVFSYCGQVSIKTSEFIKLKELFDE